MRHFHRIRNKFVRATLFLTGFIAAATLALVQRHLEAGATSHGEALVDNPALALRGLARDEAPPGLRALVGRAMAEDVELLYGVYIDAHRRPLAHTHHGAPTPLVKAVTSRVVRRVRGAEGRG